MDFTTYYANKIIDHMFRNQAFTVPSALYLGLFTTSITAAGAGTEVTGGSYFRQALTLTAPVDGLSWNTTRITYAGMPMTVLVAASIHDAAAAGNMLFRATFPEPIVVTSGQAFTFEIGEVKVRLRTGG